MQWNRKSLHAEDSWDNPSPYLVCTRADPIHETHASRRETRRRRATEGQEPFVSDTTTTGKKKCTRFAILQDS